MLYENLVDKQYVVVYESSGVSPIPDSNLKRIPLGRCVDHVSLVLKLHKFAHKLFIRRTVEYEYCPGTYYHR